MWKPHGNQAARIEYRLKGVSIGDVGIIDSRGYFQYLFNIFLPSKHPIHEGYTPREFYPIEPSIQPEEVRNEEEYFKPGHIIASKGVSMELHSASPL